MKRSTFIGLTLFLITIEISYSIASLNEMYKFLNGVLQLKYYILFLISYVGMILFSAWYFIFGLPEIYRSTYMKEHFLKIYGKKKYNILYTLHFISFSCMAFYLNSWHYFCMSLGLWIFWSWIRNKQNNYAEKYEIESLKEEAKNKPTVILDNNELL